MKAEINSDGRLLVIAETPIEWFALKVFWEDFNDKKKYVIGIEHDFIDNLTTKDKEI